MLIFFKINMSKSVVLSMFSSPDASVANKKPAQIHHLEGESLNAPVACALQLSSLPSEEPSRKAPRILGE